jgi:hypothetical protein
MPRKKSATPVTNGSVATPPGATSGNSCRADPCSQLHREHATEMTRRGERREQHRESKTMGERDMEGDRHEAERLME